MSVEIVGNLLETKHKELLIIRSETMVLLHQLVYFGFDC